MITDALIDSRIEELEEEVSKLRGMHTVSYAQCADLGRTVAQINEDLGLVALGKDRAVAALRSAITMIRLGYIGRTLPEGVRDLERTLEQLQNQGG